MKSAACKLPSQMWTFSLRQWLPSYGPERLFLSLLYVAYCRTKPVVFNFLYRDPLLQPTLTQQPQFKTWIKQMQYSSVHKISTVSLRKWFTTPRLKITALNQQYNWIRLMIWWYCTISLLKLEVSKQEISVRPIQSELFRSRCFPVLVVLVSRYFGQTMKSYMLTFYCKRTWINKKFI